MTTFFGISVSALDWTLLLILVLLVKRVGSSISSQSQLPPPTQPAEPIVLRTFTPLQLSAFTGKDNSPVYMAVLGKVYDVSPGRGFYGPDGPYANFAGRDASRGLSQHSFDEEMLVDPAGPIDKLDDLDAEERDAVREWAAMFDGKYVQVGTLIENDASA
ncbi:hypothetical protein HDU86_004821 [Geranomyces michiganensis]|nr:hypothetical protein HDU86_004821 [Geranomyces michiganensis]